MAKKVQAEAKAKAATGNFAEFHFSGARVMGVVKAGEREIKIEGESSCRRWQAGPQVRHAGRTNPRAPQCRPVSNSGPARVSVVLALTTGISEQAAAARNQDTALTRRGKCRGQCVTQLLCFFAGESEGVDIAVIVEKADVNSLCARHDMETKV
jgi:hypothetical protein